jgi:ABC-type multidrug transport system fused ATPase/permease subunit
VTLLFVPAAPAVQIGIVAQEPTLFTGTIYDNIVYGRPDVRFCFVFFGFLLLPLQDIFSCVWLASLRFCAVSDRSL